MYPSCRKIDNVSTLSIFLQLGYTQYKINKFLCRTLQRIDAVYFFTTSICCRCTQLVRNLYATCTQLVGKLVTFCTNLHALIFLHLSKKIHSNQISTDTQILTCSKNTATCNTQHNIMSNSTFAAAAIAIDYSDDASSVVSSGRESRLS
jgi:hypothetical protein